MGGKRMLPVIPYSFAAGMMYECGSAKTRLGI